jgi:hypothetical protein
MLETEVLRIFVQKRLDKNLEVYLSSQTDKGLACIRLGGLSCLSACLNLCQLAKQLRQSLAHCLRSVIQQSYPVVVVHTSWADDSQSACLLVANKEDSSGDSQRTELFNSVLTANRRPFFNRWIPDDGRPKRSDRDESRWQRQQANVPREMTWKSSFSYVWPST